MSFNPNTTWVGLLGGGVTGSIIAGGSIFQIDLWHMGGHPLPARVLVTGKRVGAMAEASTGMAALIVTGVNKAKEMEGITSSGLDWEFAVGVKGSALVKTGAKLFKAMAADAAAETVNWATHEAAKRFVQWTMNDLGVVQKGKQFNLLPSPVSLGIGMGLFYEWQTMSLLGGKIGWQYIKPKWSIETYNNQVRIQMMNIPEQDGEQVKLGFAVDVLGIDPHIRWERTSGDAHVGRNRIQIIGYAHQGYLFERRNGTGYSGINLTNFRPIGRSEAGLFTVDQTKTVKTKGTITVRPEVFQFGNYAFWSASDTVTMELDGEGRFVGAKGTSDLRN